MLGNNKSEVCCWAHSASSQPLWEKDGKKGVSLSIDELKVNAGAIHGKEKGRQVQGMEIICLEQPQK